MPSFRVDWIDVNNDVLFHFNVRSSGWVVVMNTKSDGVWGTEESLSMDALAGGTNATWVISVDEEAGVHVLTGGKMSSHVHASMHALTHTRNTTVFREF